MAGPACGRPSRPSRGSADTTAPPLQSRSGTGAPPPASKGLPISPKSPGREGPHSSCVSSSPPCKSPGNESDFRYNVNPKSDSAFNEPALVAKPVRGSGSRGVFFVRGPEDAQVLAQQQGTLFQEYLGDPATLEAYFATLRGPAPLFVQSPDPGHYSCNTVISPYGAIGPVFVMFNHHDYGHTVRNHRVLDPTLDALTLDYARALVAEGATG